MNPISFFLQPIAVTPHTPSDAGVPPMPDSIDGVERLLPPETPPSPAAPVTPASATAPAAPANPDGTATAVSAPPDTFVLPQVPDVNIQTSAFIRGERAAATPTSTLPRVESSPTTEVIDRSGNPENIDTCARSYTLGGSGDWRDVTAVRPRNGFRICRVGVGFNNAGFDDWAFGALRYIFNTDLAHPARSDDSTEVSLYTSFNLPYTGLELFLLGRISPDIAMRGNESLRLSNIGLTVGTRTESSSGHNLGALKFSLVRSSEAGIGIERYAVEAVRTTYDQPALRASYYSLNLSNYNSYGLRFPIGSYSIEVGLRFAVPFISFLRFGDPSIAGSSPRGTTLETLSSNIPISLLRLVDPYVAFTFNDRRIVTGRHPRLLPLDAGEAFQLASAAFTNSANYYLTLQQAGDASFVLAQYGAGPVSDPLARQNYANALYQLRWAMAGLSIMSITGNGESYMSRAVANRQWGYAAMYLGGVAAIDAAVIYQGFYDDQSAYSSAARMYIYSQAVIVPNAALGALNTVYQNYLDDRLAHGDTSLLLRNVLRFPLPLIRIGAGLAMFLSNASIANFAPVTPSDPTLPLQQRQQQEIGQINSRLHLIERDFTLGTLGLNLLLGGAADLLGEAWASRPPSSNPTETPHVETPPAGQTVRAANGENITDLYEGGRGVVEQEGHPIRVSASADNNGSRIGFQFQAQGRF